MKTKLHGYGVDPFSSESTKHIPSENKIDGVVVIDMLRAKTLGLEQYTQFVIDRLVKGTVEFFVPITINKLQTGIQVPKKTPKAVEVLKEDCQAFGIVISRALSREEGFKYPITSVPLSVATPDGDFRQSDKASLRHCLIEQSNSTTRDIPQKASWLIDGLAAVQTLKSKSTYGDWLISLMRFMTPPDVAEAILVGMANDTYQELNAKSSTRQRVRSCRGPTSKELSSTCLLESNGMSSLGIPRTRSNL